MNGIRIVISKDKKQASFFYPHKTFNLYSDLDVTELVIEFLSSSKIVEYNHKQAERRILSSMEDTVWIAA